MTQGFDDHIRRRHDGSIDMEFYADRATRLRRAAMIEDPKRWAKHFRTWLRNWRGRRERLQAAEAMWKHSHFQWQENRESNTLKEQKSAAS